MSIKYHKKINMSMTLFKDGYASFRENKKWGLINNQGKIIFKPSEDYFFNFGNDVLISKKNELTRNKLANT